MKPATEICDLLVDSHTSRYKIHDTLARVASVYCIICDIKVLAAAIPFRCIGTHLAQKHLARLGALDSIKWPFNLRATVK